MVRYEFFDKQGDWVRYKYYPEDRENWGIVSINVDFQQGVIDTLAENDSIHRVQMGIDKYVNVSSYAGHVINHILDKVCRDEIPQNGIVMWY